MQPSPIGLVGLGLVGQALAQRLREAGHAVIGHDVRPEACAAFTGPGFTTADLPQLGRASPQVVLAVFDTAGVLQVLEGGQALLGPGHVVQAVVDCSTGDPELLAPLSTRLAARGIDFLEAPLSGSSAQIAAGAATMLLGGEPAAVARCEPLLQALSPRRIHVGAAGMGARAKLATNLVLGLNRAVLAEGFVFAQAQGLAPATFLELVLATPARSAAAEAKGRKMVEEDFSPESRIRQHLKDVELMLQGARAAGATLPFSETHAALMRAAVRAGDGDLDNAGLLRQLRRGLPDTD
jgi:3-hydroxyisobutyrate dehydrogenase-like beta-hydroxyacid dehydrogenase